MESKDIVDQLIKDHYQHYIQGLMERLHIGEEEAHEVLHTLYMDYWATPLIDHQGNILLWDQYVRVKGRLMKGEQK